MADEKNITKVRLTICGNQFVVKADESLHYIQKIAKMVDERVKELEESSSKINVQMATIMAALNYCDQFEKERMITRELLKKTENAETVAKEATDRLQQLLTENEQLKEEKNGLHKIIAELKNGTYTEVSETETAEVSETPSETEMREVSEISAETETAEISETSEVPETPSETVEVSKPSKKATTRKRKSKTTAPKP